MSKCPECDAWTKNGKCRSCGWVMDKTGPNYVQSCMRCESKDIAATIYNRETGVVSGHLCLEHTPAIDRNWRDNLQMALQQGKSIADAKEYAFGLDEKRLAQR